MSHVAEDVDQLSERIAHIEALDAPGLRQRAIFHLISGIDHPRVDGGEVIAIRSMIYLSLSYDHRLVDGADAARYLTAIKNRIEEGAFESELGI